MKQEEEIIIRRYLLGELAEQERRQFEERLMTDDELFNDVLIAEEEIAEEYADGSLSDDERERAERVFISTREGREQLNFNIALNQYLSETTSRENSPQTPPVSIASHRITFADILRQQMQLVAMALAAMVLLAALSAWFVIRSSRLESELDQLRADQNATQQRIEQSQRELDNAQQRADQLQKENQDKQEDITKLREDIAKLSAELETKGQPGGDSELLVVYSDPLIPNDTRGSDDIPAIGVNPNTKTVVLNLRFEGTGHKGFSAQIARESRASQTVPRSALKFKSLGSETRVTVRMPYSLLPPGEYVLTLIPVAAGGSGEQASSSGYRFRVVMK